MAVTDIPDVDKRRQYSSRQQRDCSSTRNNRAAIIQESRWHLLCANHNSRDSPIVRSFGSIAVGYL
ncbi:hypothetical protein OH76DRAFT_429526 [Lentinus brumalis]|uniref:Uncharacterized protein n=1 Tax=Lentinus brumalis TaxID=2498619 RepID=A0A371DDL1_9APHY|nr:hypothetical protein OH76DRAFT_429526 [Polyporus brumalis]